MPTRRRRKIITRVIVFLLLGAIVNVAVACCIPFLSSVAQVSRPIRVEEFTDDQLVSAIAQIWTNESTMDVHSFDATKTGISRRWYVPTVVGVAFGVSLPPHRPRSIGLQSKWEATGSASLIDSREVQVPSIEYVRSGWPFLALEGHVLTQFSENLTVPLETIGFNVSLVQTPSGWRIGVPYKPVWPEFIANTIFYAAILWVLIFIARTPGSVRRTLRRRRGLCPACAYPVGTSPVCTECGKPVIRK